VCLGATGARASSSDAAAPFTHAMPCPSPAARYLLGRQCCARLLPVRQSYLWGRELMRCGLFRVPTRALVWRSLNLLSSTSGELTSTPTKKHSNTARIVLALLDLACIFFCFLLSFTIVSHRWAVGLRGAIARSVGLRQQASWRYRVHTANLRLPCPKLDQVPPSLPRHRETQSQASKMDPLLHVFDPSDAGVCPR
jgi:hypothetical protein